MKMMEGLCCLASSKRFFTSLRQKQEEVAETLGWGQQIYSQLLNDSPKLKACLGHAPHPHPFERRRNGILPTTPFCLTSLTFRSPPATWTSGLRRRWRRRWSCWPQSPRPWPGRTFQCQEGQRGGSLATGCAYLRGTKQREGDGLTHPSQQAWSGPGESYPSLTCEQVGELDGQDDGFFEGFLGTFQPCHIVPPHIRLLHHNGPCSRKATGSRGNSPPLQPWMPSPPPYAAKATQGWLPRPYPSAVLAASSSQDCHLRCHCHFCREREATCSQRQLCQPVPAAGYKGQVRPWEEIGQHKLQCGDRGPNRAPEALPLPAQSELLSGRGHQTGEWYAPERKEPGPIRSVQCMTEGDDFMLWSNVLE